MWEGLEEAPTEVKQARAASALADIRAMLSKG